MKHNREYDEPGMYQIVVSGNLDERWSDWFDGFSLTQTPDNETVLKGCVADQSALHGLLNKIRDIGIPLLSIERLKDNNSS